MTSTFNARNAEAYDQLMGRWSRLLAPKFLALAGCEPGDKILEMGCGTGSLTFAIPGTVASVTAIDASPIYVAAARARNTTPTITIEEADGHNLPYPDQSFDRAFSLLVLQHVENPQRCIQEMTRVTKKGGTIAAAVWDTYGGMGAQRTLWDTAAALDPEAARRRARAMNRPAAQPGALAKMFTEAGLHDVQTHDIIIRMNFSNFDDWWNPVASGEGSLGDYVSSLAPEARDTLKERAKVAYAPNETDAAHAFVAVATMCLGKKL